MLTVWSPLLGVVIGWRMPVFRSQMGPTLVGTFVLQVLLAVASMFTPFKWIGYEVHIMMVLNVYMGLRGFFANRKGRYYLNMLLTF